MLHVGVCCVLLCLFLVALWSPAGIGLISWVSCLLCYVTFPNVLVHIRVKGEVGAFITDIFIEIQIKFPGRKQRQTSKYFCS